MTTATTDRGRGPRHRRPSNRSAVAASRAAFKALLLRDLTCAAQEPQGVHPPHGPAAVPARLRVHLRVPEDRPGRSVWGAAAGGGGVRHAPRRRRRGHHHPLPGDPVGGAADGPGVRVHEGDRGPCARAAAGLAWLRSQKVAFGRGPRPPRRASSCSPSRRSSRASDPACTCTSPGRSCSRSIPLACIMRLGARAQLRDLLRAAHGAAHVRHVVILRSRSSAARITRGRR